MHKKRVAVLGASGIGKFHAREYARAGAEVTAILGSSKETAEKAASDLSVEYGITARPYADVGALLQHEALDAASVCTPPALHYAHVKGCLAAGLHVLCEKPFVLNADYGNEELATELITLAKKTGRVITVNTQWPAVLRQVRSFVDTSNIRDFCMYMQPESKGVDVLEEQLAHTNSMLVALVPGGRAEKVQFRVTSDEEIGVHFDYRAGKTLCTVRYTFKHKAERPRNLQFTINGVTFTRRVGEGYTQQLVTGEAVIAIEDPLKTSIEMFLGAQGGKNTPLITPEEIVENVVLQDQIVRAYLAR